MFKGNNIVKIYKGGTKALSGISFSLPSCGLVTLYGKSGSGKSTLLNILSGMDNYTEGELFYQDNLISSNDNTRSVNKEFAFIHQDYKIIENLSVLNNIAISCELNGHKPSDNEIIEVLKTVDLGEEVLHTLVKNLSGGQKQRVGIARAIIKNSKVVFADEPTGNLDSENGEKIFQALKNLSKDRLVVMVTHDYESAKQYSDIMISLKDGKISNIEKRKQENCAQGVIDKQTNAVEQSISGDLPSESHGSAKQKKLKTGMSFKRTCLLGGWSIAHKPIRIVAFTVLSILLSIIFCFALSWNFMSYDLVFQSAFPKVENEYMQISFYDNEKELYAEPYVGAIADKVGKDVAIVMSNSLQFKFSRYYPETPLSKSAFFHEAKTSMTTSIITDDLNIIGSKLVDGRMPEKVNEILISNYMADYLLERKAYGEEYNFALQKFEPKFMLESYQDIYDNQLFDNKPDKVVGIFDGRNKISDKFKDLVMEDMLGEEDIYLAGEYAKAKDNTLLIATVRPSIYLQANESKVLNRDGSAKYFDNYWRLNKYFNGEKTQDIDLNEGLISDNKYGLELSGNAQVTLKEGQILINTKYSNHDIRVGDKVEIELEEYINSNAEEIIINTKKLEFTVAGLFEHEKQGHIISQKDYDKLLASAKSTYGLMFNAEGLNIYKTVKDIRAICGKELGYRLDFSASGTQCVMDMYETFEVLQKPVGISLLVVSFVMLLSITYALVSVNIENKSNTWMILRAEGAKYKDILGVVAFQHFWLLLAQLIAGVFLTALLCVTINVGILPLFGVQGVFFKMYAKEALITIGITVGMITIMLAFITALLFRKKVIYAINKNKK